MHTLNIQLHTPILFIDYQHVRCLVYAVYAKNKKNNLKTNENIKAPLLHDGHAWRDANNSNFYALTSSALRGSRAWRRSGCIRMH